MKTMVAEMEKTTQEVYSNWVGLRTQSASYAEVRDQRVAILSANELLTDPFLLILGLTQTCFEGSMYLFVFLWVPSLQEAADVHAILPLGYIFSCFMLSMMLGSLLYTAIVSVSGDSSVTQHAKLSSLVCAVSAFALTVSVTSKDEHVRFWAFCAFESCVGMYYPVQGMLRGSLIADEHRATVTPFLLFGHV